MEDRVCDLRMLILVNIVRFVTVAQTTHPCKLQLQIQTVTALMMSECESDPA